MRDFIFHDVDPILQRLVQLAEDLGYLVLAEVTGRNTSEKLARININETELRPFLRPAADEGGDPDHGVDLDPGDAEEPEDADAAEFDPAESLGRAVHVASASDLARAAFRWALQNAGSNMNSVRKCKFKLSAWSPKGDRLVYSARFSCEDPEFQVEEEEAGVLPLSTSCRNMLSASARSLSLPHAASPRASRCVPAGPDLKRRKHAALAPVKRERSSRHGAGSHVARTNQPISDDSETEARYQ